MKKMILLLIIVFSLVSIANASSIGASLIVPPDKNTSLTISYNPTSPIEGDIVYIYADYQSNSTEVLNATVNITISGANHSMNYDSSHNAYEYSYYSTSSTTLPISVTAKKVGYKQANATSALAIAPKPTTNIGSGGAYRSIISIVTNNETATHQGIGRGENITIPINTTAHAFQYLILTAVQQIAHGNVYIKTDSCSIHNSPNNWVPYDCISLSLSNIQPDQYDGNLLYFKVSKYWVKNEDINISKIFILHIHNQTQEKLNVLRIDNDSNYYYFYTTFHNFSNFVIYGIKNANHCGDGICSGNETFESCSADCANTNIPSVTLGNNCCLFEVCYEIGICWYWWVAIALGVGAYYSYSYKKKKFSKEKEIAQKRLNSMEPKLKALREKSKNIEKELKKLKKSKKTSGKIFGRKLGEYKKVEGKIKDYRDKIVDIEHKYSIHPKTKKKK